MAETLTLGRLIAANIRFKPLTAIFNVLMLAVGIAAILTLVHMRDQLDKRFIRDMRGIDLVVGGKGSPLQIILSSVFHIDIPTGNIPLEEAEKLMADPMVKAAIPLALGDNYDGYRIVGTTAAYISHYGGDLANGRLFVKKMEVVLGSEVALRRNLKVGDRIVGAHGLTGSGEVHEDQPYHVVGILGTSGSVIDRLVLTPVESVWHVHEEHHHDHDEEAAREEEGRQQDEIHDHQHEGEDSHLHDEAREITALLIAYKSPLAASQLPRKVNRNSSMQAASPAFEIARLNRLTGTGEDILSAFGFLLIGFSACGLLITMYNAVNERRYDIALIRSLGATRKRVLSCILSEVMLLGLAGSITGIVLTHLFLGCASAWVRGSKHIVLEPVPVLGAPEICAMMAALAISLLAGSIPAVKAYRMDIVRTLVQVP